MIRLLAIGLIVLSALPLEAQERENLEQKITVHDSLYEKPLQELDSIQRDAAQAQGKLKHQFDSVWDAYSRTMLSIQYNIDSLAKINLPANKLTQKLDSLTRQKEQKLGLLKTKADSIRSNTIGRINQLNLPPEIHGKVKQYTGLLDKVDLSIPSADLEVPSLIIGDQLSGLPTPELNNPFSKELSDLSMPSIPGVENIGQPTEQLQSLQSKLPQDISNVDQLAKTAEGQLLQLNEVKGIEGQLGNVPPIPLTAADAQNQLISQVQEAAIDHFADKGEELKMAMEKFSKYKKKFPNINSLSEITRHPPNPMKGKPFIERVVPGIQFQLQRKNGDMLTDINIYFGYLLTGRLTSGLGWNERVAYTMDVNIFNTTARVFGPRAFGEFKLGNGFSPRLEVEMMNTVVPTFANPHIMDTGNREWVFGAMAGIKKEYSFFKHIKGTTSIMFNLFNYTHKKPYIDVVNARFGFEFPMKKRVKGG